MEFHQGHDIVAHPLGEFGNQIEFDMDTLVENQKNIALSDTGNIPDHVLTIGEEDIDNLESIIKACFKKYKFKVPSEKFCTL